MIDGRASGERWKWEKGRQYCQREVGTDYYSMNSFSRQARVFQFAMENNLKIEAFMGLFRDDETNEWLWASGEETNNFFYWRKGIPEEESTSKIAVVRFDLFGGGWDDVGDTFKASFLICSKR